jgi:hypothetical protein
MVLSRPFKAGSIIFDLGFKLSGDQTVPLSEILRAAPIAVLASGTRTV